MLSFFVISTHLGGAERSLLDFLKALKKQGDSFVIVTPKSAGPLLSELDNLGIKWECLPLPTWYLSLSRRNWGQVLVLAPVAFFYSFFYLLRLHLFIRRHKITKAHSTGLKYHLLLGVYAFVFRKFRLYLHLRDILKNKHIKTFLQWLAKAKNISFASNSKVTAESVKGLKSKIIYNGFEASEGKTERLRKDFDLPENKFLVGIVGAIARWKGQREFLLMARKLTDLGYDFHFVIVGDEIYDTSGDHGEMHELKRDTQSFLIYDRVSFLGFQKNTKDIYQILDVLVHASIEPEPFGRVILEAMAESCPVTAANIGGPLEIITPGKDGLLHEPANIQSMVENVIWFHDSPKETKKMTDKAKQTLNKFSMEIHSKQMRDFLQL